MREGRGVSEQIARAKAWRLKRHGMLKVLPGWSKGCMCESCRKGRQDWYFQWLFLLNQNI